MSVEDGGECNDYDETGVFVCKEGSGCVPDNTSSTGYKCMKITTTLKDEITCTGYDDPSCPADSYCGCNSINGIMQCIPYTANNKDLLEYYKKMLSFDDPECEEAYFYGEAIMMSFYAYDKYYRCYTTDLIPIPPVYPSSDSVPGSSSDRKPLAFSLVLFLIVGLIRAFF